MVNLTYTIPDAKYADFKRGFIKSYPVSLDPFTRQPRMSEDAWIIECGKQFYRGHYENGKTKIASETTVPTIDRDIVGISDISVGD